jgi:hypothetical protein
VENVGFEREGMRLLGVAGDVGITLRLVGSVAFALRCPVHAHLQERLGRAYADVDLVGIGKEAERTRRVFADEGYDEDAGVYVESQGSRLVFHHPATRLHVDVFLDRMEFCHTIDLSDRLLIDEQTVPLAELLMTKMQIVEINEKDLVDTIILLLEHPLGDIDRETINMELIARLCATDWGWWRTLTMNLEKTRGMALSYAQLTDAEKQSLADQVDKALERVSREPKSLGWRVRAKVGDRRKWYADVGELTPIEEV